MLTTMKKEYIIPTTDVLLMQTQPLLTASLIELGDEEVKEGLSRDLDLFEIGDQFESGF